MFPTTGTKPSSTPTLPPCECALHRIMSHASHPSFLTLVKYPHIISRPWVAPSHRAVPILASALQSAYGLISSIPTLLVVDADTLELLTSGGCPWVRKDASASAFPWRGLPAPPPDFGSSNALVPMMAVSPVHIYIFISVATCVDSLSAYLPSF